MQGILSVTPTLGSPCLAWTRDCSPDPYPAEYGEPRTRDHTKTFRTRPRVTWNRFPLSEGQVVPPLLLPLPAQLSWQPPWGVGGWTHQLLARLPSMLCVHPVSPSLPFGQAGQGGRRARGVGEYLILPCHSLAEGSPLKVTTSSLLPSVRGFPCRKVPGMGLP